MQSASVARWTTGTPWHAIAQLYQRAESTERGYVWLNKFLPAFIFGLIGAMKLVLLGHTLSVLTSGAWDQKQALHAGYQGAGAAFFILVAVLFATRKRPVRRVQSPFHGLIALLGSFIMVPAAFTGVVIDQPWLILTADLLMILGTAGAAIALASLGRCFAIFPEARGLVTHGAYRFVRHPMYLFEFIAFLGILLPALTPLNAALYLAFVVLQLTRMVYEEQALAATFPDEYPSYCRRTARLIPGLY
jgi:protein-S-isoprenylcysteine O-methyltransferase Ste14